MQSWAHKALVLLVCGVGCAVASPRAFGQQEAEFQYSDEKVYAEEGSEAAEEETYNADDCGSEVAYGGRGHAGELWDRLYEKYRFRHSSIDGRATGRGFPLRGTSWLNRPYSIGLEAGAFVMTSEVSSNGNRNNDVLGAFTAGYDWDHYWGSQFRFVWTSPELSTDIVSTDDPSNDLFIYDLSLMYYPWGDSRVRPYYRFGLGLSDVEFINPLGNIEDDMLFTMPLGIGIKYQTKRWFALRAEAVDNITFGQNSANTMHNFTLSFGMEWRLGGRPTTSENGWSSPSRVGTW